MRHKIFSTLLLLFSLTSTIGAMAQIEEPISWSVESDKTSSKATFRATIDKTWHMYDLGPYSGGPNATTFTFKLPAGVKLGAMRELTPSDVKMDNIFNMEIGTYADKAIFEQLFINTTGSNASVTGFVKYQACDDESCLTPAEWDFSITVVPTSEAQMATIDTATLVAHSAAVAVAPDVTSEVSGQIKTEQKSLWAIIIEAILWGFAALLTPCVFPMVPMTVSFFMKGSGSKARGRFMASIYGVSIIALYTLPIAVLIGITYFGGGEAITANIFNWLATHWIPNTLFFLVFIVFAASFFGAFEITMPSKLVNRSDSKADKGGLIGVFFMATTLVLVSFSCTGPIVGLILVKSTSGEIWEPIITMLAFSTAFALPFTIFALFPSLLKNLPKSGGWLNSVKVVLGFIELALALKFLMTADQAYHWGILDREVYLSLWIVIFSLLGLYLLGKITFAHDSKVEHISVKRLFLAIATFAFVIYMIPGMWGAPLKAISGYLPPISTMDFSITSGGGAATSSSSLEISKIDNGRPKYSDYLHTPVGIDGFFDLNEGMEYARKVNRPVFLDFTGHGCNNCREMEVNVLSDPLVRKILNDNYVFISLYVDDKKELPASDWVTTKRGKVLQNIGDINATLQIERFKANAQPYYVLLNPNTDNMLVAPRAYSLNVAEFIQFLENGLKAYQGQ